MDDQQLPLLEEAIGRIWEKARAMGLDPFPVRFEMVPASILYEFGSYLLPGRFSHWTFGKAYYQLKTEYDYGLSRIYELVINSDPCYAFLLESNTLLQNTFVAAHVMGHSDFFKHNAYFARTNRQMLETVSCNAGRIRRYNLDEDNQAVEETLDAALGLSHHVDPYPRRQGRERAAPQREGPFDDLFPASEAAAEEELAEEESDLLRFLIERSPVLEDWQRDILSIVRDETLYFVPQMQTKIMNEGWASYWHSRIMRELDLTDEEYTDFARLHAAVCTPSRTRLNPYYLGLRLFEDIERRYGSEKIFEVRELESDVSFVRNYLTEELVEDLDLYVFRLEENEWKVADKAWESVRDAVVNQLTSLGVPTVTVADADHRGLRELFLRHHYDGRELLIPYAEKTLQMIVRLWGRPVHLETVVNGRRTLITADGDNLMRQEI